MSIVMTVILGGLAGICLLIGAFSVSAWLGLGLVLLMAASAFEP